MEGRMVMLQFNSVPVYNGRMGENGYVTDVLEGGHVRFNGGRMVMLWRWPV